MRLRLSMIGGFMLMLAQVAAASSIDAIWHVEPGECVVSQSSEYCDIMVSVSLNATDLESPCIYVQQQWKGCFSAQQLLIKFPIIVADDVRLNLVDANRHTIASYTIDHRIMQTKQQRRRIRLPWSVF